MRITWFLPFILVPATCTPTICPPANDSTVILTSGSSRYMMAVPANKTQFSVVGPDQQLGCIQTGTKYSSCLPCNFPVNQLGVTPEAGFCSFNISGRASLVYQSYGNGHLTVIPPSQILDVECGLVQQDVLPPPPSVATRDLVQELTIDPNLCHDAWRNSDQYQVIWLWSGDTKYVMNVYPDDTWYNVDLYAKELIKQVGCAIAPADHSVVGTQECLRCDMVFDKVRYDGTHGGRCEFDTGGYVTEITPSSDDTEASSFTGGPGQIRMVRCTINRYLDPPSTPLVKPQASSAILEFTRDTTGQTPPQGVSCPAWANKVVIDLQSYDREVERSVDYNLEVRPDGNYFDLEYPRQSTGCLRRDKLYTGQCFPCSDIEVTYIRVNGQGVWCTFNVENYPGTHLQRHNVTLKGWEPGYKPFQGKIYGVLCNIENNPPDLRNPSLEKHADYGITADSSSYPCKSEVVNKYAIRLKNVVSTVYRLDARDDQQYYLLGGSDPPLPCYTGKSPQCTRCDQPGPWKAIQVPATLGECRFKLEGQDELLAVEGCENCEHFLQPPAQIEGLECGYGINSPPRAAQHVGSDSLERRASGITRVAPPCDLEKGNPVVLVADNGVYAINVPDDRLTYSITGAHVDLGCVNIENQQNCQLCNQKYTSVRVDESLGACYIATDGGPPIHVSSRKGGYVFGGHRSVESIACGFPALEGMDMANGNEGMATRNEDAVSTLSGPSCFNYGADPVILVSSKGVYSVYPPQDWKTHTLSGADAELGCLRISLEGQSCLPCEGPFLFAQIPEYLGSCFFYSPQRLPIEAKSGMTTNLPVMQVDMIACGPTWVSSREVTDTSARNVTPRNISVTGMNAAAPSSPNQNDCPASAGWKVTITAMDGHIYFAPVPLDFHFHPTPEMHCVRLADAACIPCDNIWPVSGVSTSIKWGPCIFFFYDRQAVNTQYWNKNPNDENSQVIETVWFGPAGIISGIECGTGA